MTAYWAVFFIPLFFKIEAAGTQKGDIMRKIKIFDTTLRDGEQTPGVNLNPGEKVIIAKKLDRMGVGIIEAGFAAASEGDFQAIRAISKAVENASVASLARALPSDIDRAWEAVKEAKHPRIHTFIATSPIHMKYKLKMTEDEVYRQAVQMVAYAKVKCRDVEFSCEDATRSEKRFLYRVIQGAIDAGANVINIPDTVGYSHPDEFHQLIRDIRENVPNIECAEISVHCHNDLGLATANAAAAIRAGASQVECAINGLGERAGNTALEEISMLLKVREADFGAYTDIVHEHIAPISSTVSQLTGIVVQPNKSIVGGNAFAHESGIHQHGVLENTSTYEIITPESVGVRENRMVFGKHSGKHAFINKLKEMGYDFDEEKNSQAFKKFKELTDIKKEIFDRDIESIAQGYIGERRGNTRLVTFEVVRHSLNCVKADIVIESSSRKEFGTGTGDGPVNAIYQGVNTLLKREFELKEYSIHGVTGGADAQGEVRVRVAYGDTVRSGKSIHTDIVRASAEAYIDAINNFDFK